MTPLPDPDPNLILYRVEPFSFSWWPIVSAVVIVIVLVVIDKLGG